jgi:hypothetical protein
MDDLKIIDVSDDGGVMDITPAGIHTLQESTVRDRIIEFKDRIMSLPGRLIGDSPEYLAVCPLKHTFVDGAYVREIFLPKGMIFVTKIHKYVHPYFVMSGDVSVLTEDGIVRIKGPHHGITPAGTIRVIYVHEDTVWITVHVTNETDPEKIVEQVTAKDFGEMDELLKLRNTSAEVTL